MSIPAATAPRRLTSATLSVGVALSAACFVIAGVSEVAGTAVGSGDMTDVGALFDGLVAWTPWAWASLGVLGVVMTPALGLLATAYEFASVSDRRAVVLALAVLGVLVTSTIVAVLR